MPELLQQLMQKAHLSAGQAQQVLDVALNFIRTHVPALASMLGGMGGGTAAPTSAPTSSVTPPQSGGGMLGTIEGALGGLFSGGGGGLHHELVQNAGLNPQQATSSVNVIKDFITQHVPSAAGMMQEGSTLDNIEDKVDGFLGIHDNNTGK